MKITHRVPWSAAYGYSEIESEEGLSEEEMTNALYEVAQMEAQYRSAYELPAIGASPLTDNAMNLGARPAPAPQAQNPRREAPPQQYRTENAGSVNCERCGNPTEYKPAWFNKKSGKNVSASYVCTSGCKNDKGYPLSVWAD